MNYAVDEGAARTGAHPLTQGRVRDFHLTFPIEAWDSDRRFECGLAELSRTSQFLTPCNCGGRAARAPRRRRAFHELANRQ